MYVFNDNTVETIFNENGEEFANVPEITFEEHTVKYLAENYYTTLDLVDLNIPVLSAMQICWKEAVSSSLQRPLSGSTTLMWPIVARRV